ncbi:hypothetical protein [Halostagnicola kamekurae]|uniref:hypothetical protein n=1 Tax=Halostagnicola kamekurae TaxID=619731 RepID=UPI000B80B4A0|nr:hypothetical protein [Halostagnicola kamekurae]
MNEQETGNWVRTSTVGRQMSDQVSVRTIVDPDNPAHRLGDLENNDIGVVESNVVEGDDNGLLETISVDSLNDDSVTRIGGLDSRGRLRTERAAFVIANLGGVGDPTTDGATVEILLNLYTDSAGTEGARMGQTDAIRFPYTIPLRNESGWDLLDAEPIRLGPREAICVGIELDSHQSGTLETIETFGLTVQLPSTE